MGSNREQFGPIDLKPALRVPADWDVPIRLQPLVLCASALQDVGSAGRGGNRKAGTCPSSWFQLGLETHERQQPFIFSRADFRGKPFILQAGHPSWPWRVGPHLQIAPTDTQRQQNHTSSQGRFLQDGRLLWRDPPTAGFIPSQG